MEANSWRSSQADPAGGGDPGAVDWRTQLQPEARLRIVNKIMETLKKHLPISVPEGLNELQKIANRFEEKIYTAATSQSDYLKKISLKMLSMESKTQPAPNPAMSNGPAVNQNSVEQVGIQSQITNQPQSFSTPLINQSSARLPQNLQNNTSGALQGSANLPSALSTISSVSQSTISNVGQASNLQNISGLSQNSLSNSVGQLAPTDIYANAQRQMPGRQQQQQQQQQQIISQQQQQSQNQLMYQQQQLHQQLLKQKFQQQQQSSQQALLMSSSLQGGQSTMQQTQQANMHSSVQAGLQQNQLNSVQQPVQSLLQSHSQSVSRQQQQAQPTMHQQASLQQQSAPVPQQSNILMQQQPHPLMGQQASISGTQQNNVPEMQSQQQRLSVQQNGLLNMQQPQQMLNQQTISLHQSQQLGPQNTISGLQQQQQQLLGTVPNLQNMQPHQRQIHLMQPSKNAAQQQPQAPQGSLGLLQQQSQQSQLQSAQQQLMSQFQSQPPQMQQLSNSLPREMHQRLQSSAALLQQPSAMEQQKLFIQSQRGLQEVSSSTSIDSTAQTGHAGAADWQEEMYQKIKSMKELYCADLTELYTRIAMKLQQHDSIIPPAKPSDQYEKMKNFKMLLDKILAILQLNKGNIQIALKDKLPLYEKQIMSILSSHKRKVIPQQQQGQPQFQHPSGHSHSMPQQQPSQVAQLQKHDNHTNQLQQVNLQGTASSMQSAGGPNMQHVSMPLSTNFGVTTAQQNITSALQSGSNLDSVQASSFNSFQQGSHQVNANTLAHSSMSTAQPNVNPAQSNSSTLQQQHLKQQEQHLQAQQMKQQFQQHKMQLFQQQQKQQLLQQQLPLQQQMHQQQKPQQATQIQMTQVHQTNEINELKVRQTPGMKPGLYQQQHYPPGSRSSYYHPQLKPVAPFPISSPQNLQASSPQISHHSSPQIDQHSLLSSQIKSGTPLQPASSPFAPSPSTPIAPSPLPGDSENKLSNISSVPNAGQIVGHQQIPLAPPAQSLAVGTPGMSASPLLAEFTRGDGNQASIPTLVPSKAGATERPLDRLIKVVQSATPQALSSAISDIGSVVSMIDRIAGSAPGNGSRAAVGEDLVAMTKCRLQARNFMTQDGNASTTKKMKRDTSAMPLNNVSSAGSVNDSFKESYSLDTSELQSTATSRVKRQKVEVNHALVEEIQDINQQLIDTVVNISEEDSDSVADVSEGGEGTVIKCSFTAVSLSPSIKSQFSSAHMSPILPLRLLVPANYPKCSPVLLDKLPDEQSGQSDDLSTKAKSRFKTSLRGLSQPMSLGEMAKMWDACARKVIAEYAQQTGGGSFSSRYGAWENCVGA